MSNSSPSVNISCWSQLDDDDDNDLLLLQDDLNLNTSSLRSDERYVGFDNNVGDTWLYPSNFPERSYQYNIVQKALFHNTLVVLPTGLGKTFIAAVVMYNIYRWYPMGKVIFMAPTRPLVAQQIDACCEIMGIPKEDSVEITGKLNKATRAQLWQSKRVFFATPQSVQSDISDGELNFPFDSVKLIVVDEAHRAKGRYAYTEVVSTIWRKNKYFRILALSATPGRRKEDVEEVIRNLFISKLEVRTDDSIDVVSYVQKREIKTVVVQLGPKLSEIRDELLAITDPHIRNLIDNRLISGRPGSISRNWLVMEQKRFRESVANSRVPQQKELNSDFSICISIYHAIELLERHGLRVFLNNFDETQDNGPKFVVILRPDLRRLIERVRQEIGPNPFAYSDQSMVNGEIAPIPKSIDFGHPKFEIARDHVLTHFEHNKKGRVIIFCEYRESVMLMHRLLLQHRPLIRPRVFVGQGGTGSIRAVTQQQQIKVMNDFRSGESNALIATSVAEEGIDVGEVDLIVCFDINTTNPTRFIQRIGRTGRKKAGKVILLATEGKEHNILKDVLSEQNKLNKSLSRGGGFSAVFYKEAPRMVPTEFNPKCQKSFIQPTMAKESKSKLKCVLPKGKQVAKIRQKHDLRHFFKQKVVLDDDEKGVFEDFFKPVDTIADISDSPLKSNSTKSNVLEEDQAIMDFSPPKELDISDKTVKKIAKYIRNSQRGQIIDIQKSINSNKFNKESLEFLLDYSPDLLTNVWTCMQGLWKRGINENNLPTKGITAEDRQAVRLYFQLLNTLGGKENIAAAVKNRNETDKTFYFSNMFKKYNFIFESAHHCDGVRTNIEYLIEKCPLSSDQCSRTSFTHSAVYDDEVDDVDHTVHSFNDSNQIMDSKYMSQWATSNNDISYVCESPQQHSAKKDPPSDDDVVFVAQQSTPIRTGPLKQSLLNFKGTPISGKLSERLFNKLKGKSISGTSTESSCKQLNALKRPQPSNEITADLFDDHFDDILAANSSIFEKIEQSNTVAKVIKGVETSPQPLSIPTCAQEAMKISRLGSNDSTPDNILFLSKGDSTPANVYPLVDHLKETQSNKTNIGLKANGIIPRDICDIRKSDSMIKDDPYNVVTEDVQLNSNRDKSTVHPELADIDFNAFSESFSEEIINHTNVSPNGNQCLQISSPDIFDEDSILDVKEKSPCKRIISPQAQISPCLLTKKPLTWKEVRLKYFKPSQIAAQNPVKKPEDDSVIILPSKSRTKRKIIDSDSDSSDNDPAPIRRCRNRIPDTQVEVPRVVIKNARRQANEFIDDQAQLSGSATEDELEETIGCYMMDSVVVHDDEVENDSSVNMTQMYLQSLRSPSVHARGAFKIPPRRQYNDASKIFSQRIPEEDDGSYMKDSFVISDEGSDDDQSMCPLERAEAILKEKRRAKRKAKLSGYDQKHPPKKKRILRIHNSSEEDDGFA